MNNLKNNKDIAKRVVALVSAIYNLDDAVLVEFKNEDVFPNKEVTAFATSDFRVVYNIDRLKIAPDYELYITSFHEMRHIYQRCCIEFGEKYPDTFNAPKERIKQWEYEFKNYYVSPVENDEKYLRQDVELDAISFAYFMMDLIFDAKVVLPDPIKDDAIKRAKEIEDSLSNNKYIKALKLNK